MIVGHSRLHVVPDIASYDDDANTDTHVTTVEREPALPTTTTATPAPAAKPTTISCATLDTTLVCMIKYSQDAVGTFAICLFLFNSSTL
jgi:hypothetical protein